VVDEKEPAELGRSVANQPASQYAGPIRVSSRRDARAQSAMKRTLISSGSTFEAEIGYSRAVVQGDWVFVSGTTGFDYSNMTISDSLLAQTEQCLKNIEAALSKAGAKPAGCRSSQVCSA
jgi:enamine deaminase RidA (YjgF/YER057c/UK114 family)